MKSFLLGILFFTAQVFAVPCTQNDVAEARTLRDEVHAIVNAGDPQIPLTRIDVLLATNLINEYELCAGLITRRTFCLAVQTRLQEAKTLARSRLRAGLVPMAEMGAVMQKQLEYRRICEGQ